MVGRYVLPYPNSHHLGQPADTQAVDMPIACFFGAGGDTIGAAEDVSGKTLTTLMFGFDAKTGRGYYILADALLVASPY